MKNGAISPEDLRYFERKNRKYTDMIQQFGIPDVDPQTSGEVYSYQLVGGGLLFLMFHLGRLVSAHIQVERNGQTESEQVNWQKRYLHLFQDASGL